MATPETLTTADDLWRMSGSGDRLELVRGELRRLAPAGSGHGATIVNLTLPLGQHVKSARLGVVFGAETGFILSRNPDTVHAPDIAFVSSERIPAGGVPERFFPGPPDLAVEVLSPGETAYEVEEKVRGWLEAGVRVVWVVSPRGRSVTIYRPGPVLQVLSASDTLTAEGLLPGFALPVGDVFD